MRLNECQLDCVVFRSDWKPWWNALWSEAYSWSRGPNAGAEAALRERVRTRSYSCKERMYWIQEACQAQEIKTSVNDLKQQFFSLEELCFAVFLWGTVTKRACIRIPQVCVSVLNSAFLLAWSFPTAWLLKYAWAEMSFWLSHRERIELHICTGVYVVQNVIIPGWLK